MVFQRVGELDSRIDPNYALVFPLRASLVRFDSLIIRIEAGIFFLALFFSGRERLPNRDHLNAVGIVCCDH